MTQLESSISVTSNGNYSVGGFDMLWSGRGRVNGRQDLGEAKTVCLELELQGLIIVGGDGSNSNAALLSEFFSEHLPACCVIGVPKTIDGDLRNPWIETSFGFDTAAKTYSELIGNLCTDVTTAQVSRIFNTKTRLLFSVWKP